MKSIFFRDASGRHGWLLAVLVASSLSAWALDPKASRLYEDALRRYEKKDLAGAVVQLKSALQVDRSILPVHVLLGKALLASGDVVGADVTLTEALRLGVNRAEVVVPLAQALLEQGKRQVVLDDARFDPAGLPPGPRQSLLLLLASMHADVGKPKEALRLIEEARAIDPASATTWLAEVPVRIRSRQFAEAAAAAERALAIAPRSPEAVYLRGSVAHTQGDLTRALAYYATALQLDPNHLESMLARAGIELDQNQLAEAQRDVAAALRIAPTEPRALYLGAVLADRRGDAKAAREALVQITALIDRVPMDFLRYKQQVLILNGLAHHGLGEPEKAKPFFEMVQRDQPGSPVAKVLGQIYLTENNVDRAIQSLEKYLRAYPTDPQALAMLASAHMSQGRHARAAQVMAEALKVQDTPTLRTVLGVSLLKSGKFGDATGELEIAFAKDPTQVQAGAALVALYLNQKQTRKAIDVAEQLVKRQPANAGLQNLLGAARVQGGDPGKARAAYEKAASLDATFVEPRLQLARLDAQMRLYDNASKRLADVLARDEKNVAAWIETGLLAESRGQTEQATQAFAKAVDHGGAGHLQALFAAFEYHLRGWRLEVAQELGKRLSLAAPEDVMVLLANARVALAMKNVDGARQLLVRASRAANFDVPQQVRIALLQLGADDAKGAAYALSKALQADPLNLQAQALLTDAEVRLGNLDNADKRARAILTAHPQLALGHSLLGDVALARGQGAAAIDAYRQAYQTEPSSAAVMRLHRALAGSDPTGSQAVLVQWLRAHAQDQAARRALADAYARAGNMPAARVSYEQLLKADPNDAAVLNNYAHVLLALRDGAGASKAANAALARQPETAHVIGTAGWVAYKTGQIDRALQLLRDARLRDPANADTRYYLAAALASSGRVAEAREELRAALRSGDGFATAKDAQELLLALK